MFVFIFLLVYSVFHIKHVDNPREERISDKANITSHMKLLFNFHLLVAGLLRVGKKL